MRSWKRRTRAQHRARLKAWKESDSDVDHVSSYVRNRLGRQGFTKRQLKSSAFEAWWSPLWRKRYALRWKRDIKAVKEGLRRFAEFPYIEDCRYHPCEVTKLEADPDWGRIDFECKSLINGTPNACSYFHCGIVHLTKEEGEERAEFARTHGMLPYQMRWVYALEGITVDQNTKVIRAHMKQDLEWGFNKNGGTEMYTELGHQWILDTYGIDVATLTPMTDDEMKAAYDR